MCPIFLEWSTWGGGTRTVLCTPPWVLRHRSPRVPCAPEMLGGKVGRRWGDGAKPGLLWEQLLPSRGGADAGLGAQRLWALWRSCAAVRRGRKGGAPV